MPLGTTTKLIMTMALVGVAVLAVGNNVCIGDRGSLVLLLSKKNSKVRLPRLSTQYVFGAHTDKNRSNLTLGEVVSRGSFLWNLALLVPRGGGGILRVTFLSFFASVNTFHLT